MELGPELGGLAEAQKIIMAVEAARAMAPERLRGEELLSPVLRRLLDEGQGTPPARYRGALELAERGRELVPRVFAGADVLVTPSTIGEAPAGLDSTGDPAFNRIWTLLHLPCLNLPAGAGPQGLPLGVQLVGPLRGEGQLLAAARWVEEALADPPRPPAAGAGP